MSTQLKNAIIEKDVENAWREKLLELFPDSKMSSPFNTDGYLESNDGKITLLLEFKYEENLKSKLSQVNILSQALFYLKKFEKSGTKLPKVILIADKNECFVIHSNPLSKYLDYDLKWNVAASTVFKTNPELIQEMLSDTDINPYVFDITPGFNFVAIKNKVEDFSNNVARLIKVNEHNINNVFEYFQRNVLGKNALSVNEVANLFINLIINPGENYLHPKRKNILITKAFGDVYVQTDKFISFFSHFDGEQYSIREKEKLTAIVDRIVEDETRRRKGEFFTPTIWVDEAHKMISDAFGENWKEEYVVWDPACGTLNLTRDYNFKELYCSTIEDSDLNTANQMQYNMDATKFQYDFLNDGIVNGKIDIENDTKLPQGLKTALLEGKKIIVLMNPPYGTANVNGNNSESREGMALTEINKSMKIDGWGASSQQLYAQFLYRISKINYNENINICVFAKSLYKSGSSYEDFRNKFYSDFKYYDGMLFCASHFDGVSTTWGIDFSIWKNGIEKRKSLPIKIKDVNPEFSEVVYLYDKNIYNLDGEIEASKWVRTDIKSLKTFDGPQFSSGVTVKANGIGKITENGIGYLLSNANNVQSNETNVAIFTGPASKAHGLSIIKDNIYKTSSLFTARRVISGKYANWINDKDEYIAPDETHANWEKFQYDSLIYSLFNNACNQSSLRQIDYKGKKWDIKNEFFWISKEEMMELAEKKYFNDIYRDARSSEDRHVYTLLFKEGIYDKLSPDAKEVLDLATKLVKESFDMREILNEEKPEYHLNTWDAGWYQVKKILNAFYPERLKEFTVKYKEFEDRLRPQVYELGFLRG